MSDPLNILRGTHFTAGQAGAWKSLGEHAYHHPRLGKTPGKLFLKEALGLTSMEVSLGRLGARSAVPFYHRHQKHEELYIFVGGEGQFQVDGETIPVREGTVIRVAPPGARTWRNTSDQDLYFIVVQAREGSMDGRTTEDGVGVNRPVEWK
jgi:uncharacterized cupin superfamily protein